MPRARRQDRLPFLALAFFILAGGLGLWYLASQPPAPPDLSARLAARYPELYAEFGPALEEYRARYPQQYAAVAGVTPEGKAIPVVSKSSGRRLVITTPDGALGLVNVQVCNTDDIPDCGPADVVCTFSFDLRCATVQPRR